MPQNQNNQCPVCGQMVDDDNYLPIAEKCRSCFEADLAALNEEQIILELDE
jgi:predicted nucleic acid-binding Zn ribbon protein